MAKKEYPYEIVSNLTRHVLLEQARLTKERNKNVTLKEVYNIIGEYCGVTGHTISMIKSGNYNPSLTLALLLSQYFGTTVNELFDLDSQVEAAE